MYRFLTAGGSLPRVVRGALAGGAVLVVLGGAAAAPAAAQSIPAEQWHISAMRLDEAWKYSTGKGVTVAVIDSGVTPSASGLAGKVLAGKDFARRTGTARDPLNAHGTGMASLIASSGAGAGSPIGVAPGATILPLRVDDFTDGTEGQRSAQMLDEWSQAIRYAADSPARVINISMGQPETGADLSSAVAYAQSKDKLIFAAVGNSGDTTNEVEYPAALPGVVGVSSFDEKGDSTKFSERGPQVALSAAGVDMFHACAGGTGFCKTSGTSDSTALASGSAALVWAKHPDWTADQVLRVLLDTAGHPASGAQRDNVLGYGAVRPRVALETPGDPGPADDNPLVATAASSALRRTAVSPRTGVTQAGPARPSAAPSAAAEPSGGSTHQGLWIGGAVAVVGAALIGYTAARRRRAAPSR